MDNLPERLKIELFTYQPTIGMLETISDQELAIRQLNNNNVYHLLFKCELYIPVNFHKLAILVAKAEFDIDIINSFDLCIEEEENRVELIIEMLQIMLTYNNEDHIYDLNINSRYGFVDNLYNRISEYGYNHLSDIIYAISVMDNFHDIPDNLRPLQILPVKRFISFIDVLVEDAFSFKSKLLLYLLGYDYDLDQIRENIAIEDFDEIVDSMIDIYYDSEWVEVLDFYQGSRERIEGFINTNTEEKEVEVI